MTKKHIAIEIPKNLVEDFILFIRYFENNPVKLTKTQEFLTKKHLLAIYALMSEPKLEVQPTKTQEGYPLLHLFFMLGIQLQVIKRDRVSRGVFASVVSKQVEAFRNLSTSEQYVVLLQCFWEKMDWSVFERRNSFRAPSNIDYLFESLEKYAANKEINVEENEHLKHLLYQYDHFLLYFSYIGLWEVELAEGIAYAGNHFLAKTLKLTPLFKKMEKALAKNWCEHLDNRDSGDDDLESFLSMIGMKPSISKPKKRKKKEITPLVTILKPIFPEANLDNPFLSADKTFTSGVFTLKVNLGRSCSRTVQLSSSHTLLDLHQLIQKSFEFNDDHLYSFYMDGKKFSQNYYNSLEEGVGPFVNEAQLGSLELIEGQRFLYLFDFGDEWEFNIEVVRISEGADITEAKIIDQKGKAPLQYGN